VCQPSSELPSFEPDVIQVAFRCGGMAKRNVPSVNAIFALSRALPSGRTNCPTRVACRTFHFEPGRHRLPAALHDEIPSTEQGVDAERDCVNVAD
jgi:hypothetical protein